MPKTAAGVRNTGTRVRTHWRFGKAGKGTVYHKTHSNVGWLYWLNGKPLRLRVRFQCGYQSKDTTLVKEIPEGAPQCKACGRPPWQPWLRNRPVRY